MAPQVGAAEELGEAVENGDEDHGTYGVMEDERLENVH